MSEFDGGAAFPFEPEYQQGMSMRDYFAAKAMQQAFSVVADVDESDAERAIEMVAKASYMMADAMLLERAK